MAAVSAAADELRNQVGMPCVNLYAVETRLATEIDRLTEFFDKLFDFGYFQSAMDGGRIEVES